MYQTPGNVTDPHYVTVFNYFCSEMSKLFERNPDEHGALAHGIAEYVKRNSRYDEPELRGFDVVYSRVETLSKRLDAQPEYIARWLFESYKGHDDFVRKLRGDKPPRQTFGREMPRRILRTHAKSLPAAI